MSTPMRALGSHDSRLLRAVEHLSAVLEKLPDQLATLDQREACVSSMTATLLTADDIARLVRADVRTVRRWVREGELPAPIRIGGALRWRRATIDKWLEERQ